MEEFGRYAALVLLAVILSLVLGKQAKDMSVLLSLGVCVLVCIGAVGFLQPVAQLLVRIRRLGNLDSETVAILLKAAGIGLISELAGLICSDAGEGAMGKALQILSSAAILWLSIPLFGQLLTMIEEVLAGI